MREIKFRAKENGNGPWRYGTYRYVRYRQTDGVRIDQHTIQTDEYEVLIDRSTLGEFTGLHDRHGKEIYEGDIIEWIDAPGMVDTFGVVEFITRRGAWYVVNDEENIYDDIYNVFDASRIVGNIHEDGDLL